MTAKIVVVGSSNTDMIIKLDRIPKPGETRLGGEFMTAPGGKGANQAVAAARAGGDVTFVARVGQDMFGEQALAGFVENRVNVDYVQFDKKPSGVALIFVGADGQNSIAVGSGANARLSPGDVRKAREAIAATCQSDIRATFWPTARTSRIAVSRSMSVSTVSPLTTPRTVRSASL